MSYFDSEEKRRIADLESQIRRERYRNEIATDAEREARRRELEDYAEELSMDREFIRELESRINTLEGLVKELLKAHAPTLTEAKP